MAWASRLPAAVDSLVATFAGWPGLGGDGVAVKDGPWTSQATLKEAVSVGWTGGEDENGAESTLLTEGLGGAVDREQFTIRCVAVVLRGSDDMTGARQRAYEILAQAGAAIAADRKLGGAVMRAMISSHSLDQAQTTQGAQAAVTFDVSCDAYSGV
jgi:hypothetical protein